MPATPEGEARVLIIDDTSSIHDDFRKILTLAPRPAFEALETALFEAPSAAGSRARFTLAFATQGQEGLALVQRSVQEGTRYALAFVDMRMPSGWDGIETVSQLWAADPDLQVVICTAYSDYPWDEMVRRLGQTDNLLLLKKPFDPAEVVQVAHALTRKWFLLQQAKWRFEDLDRTIARRTNDLHSANEQLRQEVSQRKDSELRLTAFATLGKRLSATQTAKEAAQIIVDVADHLLGWDACLCHLYSPADQRVSPVLVMDVIEGRRQECALDEDSSAPTPALRRALEEGGYLVLRDETSPGALSYPFGDVVRPSASILFVPIRDGTEVTGVLSIQSYTPRAYDASSLEVLQALADHCGGALARIRSREDLVASEANHRALVERMPDAILVHMDGKFVYANPAALSLVGAQRPEQVLGRSLWDIVPPEFRDIVAARIQNSTQGGINPPLEQQIVRLDGTPLEVEVTSIPFTYQGKPAVQTVMRDITARKQAEEALRVSEERFRSIWESSLDGMRLTDREGRMIAVNEAFCKLLKLPREKLMGQLFSMAYKDHGPNDGLEVYQLRFDTGAILPRITARVQFWNGEEVELEISSCFLELGRQGRMMLSIFRDVTERKQLEQQLRQSQKMEAIGQLAGGVAHDFNNLLAVIRGNSELVLMKEAELPEYTGECLKQVVAAADRAAGLTRQLLAFSRKQVMQAQPLNLNDVIGNFTKMLKRIIGEDIQLQCNYAARLPMVRADAAMLEQVLVNLVVNARDAMPKGGRLFVATEHVGLEADDLKEHPEARAGEFVCLSVIDTGTGIAPEHLARIFEPFFTTKEVGKGTGLGLATVYGIAKQHGGWIEVASTLGAGATFKLFLPALPAAAQAPAPAVAQPNPSGGSETILLVEDDEAVRSLTRRLLESFGYHVHEAASGPQALDVWRAHSDRIQLLLTDMVMPEGVNGRQLAERLLTECPRLKTIFMTGYSPNVAGKDTQFLRRAGSAFLQKPCHWRDLLQTTRQLLDAKNC